MANRFETPTLANTRTDQFAEILADRVTVEGDFPAILPVHHILTGTIAEGEMQQNGSGRFIEFIATVHLTQPGITSMVCLEKSSMEGHLWTPTTLELACPRLARLTIDLWEEAGQAKADIVGHPEGSIIGEEVSRFLRLASNAYKR